MPAPNTIDDLLELIRKSGVVEEKRLTAYLETLLKAPVVPDTPRALAQTMVDDGILTHFQAQQLLMGRTRRFVLAGKYRLLESLGSGGMGHVYLCEHLLLRRRVAIKVLPPTRPDDASTLERFQREARAIAALDHPNIVRCHDMDRDNDLHFLVMEYIDGSSLQEIVKKHGPMDILRACHYIRQAAVGLEHIHEAGLVHRDIKPGNLLLERDGLIKILDMGLARFFNDDDDDITRKHDETVLGTTDYLAPEQAIDSNVDIRADIYSLGATFYYLVAGRTPFADGTVAQKLIWHQTRQPKPVRSWRPEVPEGVAAIIERMMVKDPTARYQTPSEVVEALDAWTAEPIGLPPDEEMPQLCAAARGRGEISKPQSTKRPAAARPKAPRPAPATPSPRNPAPTSAPPAVSPPPSPSTARPERAPSRPSAAARPERRTMTVSSLKPLPLPTATPPAQARQTATDQAALDTEAPMARADTEPTQAKKKIAAAPAPVETAPEAPPAKAKPAKKREPLSPEMFWAIFGAAIIFAATVIWLLLALFS